MTALIISVVAMGVVVLLGVVVWHNHRIRRNNLLREAYELGKQCAAIEWWAEQDAEIVMKDTSSSPEQDIMDIVSPPPKAKKKVISSPTVTPWKKDNAKKNNKQA